jgi:Domain of unknown function (DUF1931)
MALMGVAKFERFFRAAAGIEVDKNDLNRYSDFVNDMIYDLLISAQATAKANARDVIEPRDLPITKGLHESIQQFRRMDEGLEIEPIVEHLTKLPQLHLDYSDDTREELPLVAGGLSLALARTFRVIDPGSHLPHQRQWERAFEIYRLIL